MLPLPDRTLPGSAEVSSLGLHVRSFRDEVKPSIKLIATEHGLLDLRRNQCHAGDVFDL